MSWAVAIAGAVLSVLAFVAQWYLGVRNRQLRKGARRMDEFRQLSLELLATDLPDEGRQQIEKMAALTGTGRVTRHLVRAVANGEMSQAVPRSSVEDWRRHWVDIPKEVRVRFTQAIFAGILADSYFAGLIGTIFRRTMFFVTSDPAEIAEYVDALQTRMLIVGSTDFEEQPSIKIAGNRSLVRA